MKSCQRHLRTSRPPEVYSQQSGEVLRGHTTLSSQPLRALLLIAACGQLDAQRPRRLRNGVAPSRESAANHQHSWSEIPGLLRLTTRVSQSQASPANEDLPWLGLPSPL